MKQILTAFTTWMQANNATWPAFVWHACLVAVASILAIAALNLLNYGVAAEIAQDVLKQVALCTAVIGCMGFAIVLFVPIVTASKEVFTTTANQVKELPEQAEWSPSIGVDNLVVWNGVKWPDAEYSNRHLMALSARHSAKWNVIISPFDDIVKIIMANPKDDLVFSRGAEPFLSKLEENDRVPDIDHKLEDFTAYQKYVNWFCPRFVLWATDEKLLKDTVGATKIHYQIEQLKAEQL
jgi:hypothetical protein